MKLRFSKMHGAGNDFVVLDATRGLPDLMPAQYRWLADRRFGVGADQILIVGPSDDPAIDFTYRIVNADGHEVEQCGNGARCFARYVHDAGLTGKTRLRVRTASGVIEPSLQADGRVTVDMGAPVFEPSRVPFHAGDLQPRLENGFALWPLTVGTHNLEAGVVSMGNPHAVLSIDLFGVDSVDEAPVAELGPQIEIHARFPRRVNVGFLQIHSRSRVRLRVFERGAGETLACGTGACAAAVVGMRLGRLDERVDVETRGGELTIEWAGMRDADLTAPVYLTGPAVHVFDGEIELPRLD